MTTTTIDPRKETLAVACTHPRCMAQPGRYCTTPNGRTGFFHKTRRDTAAGKATPAPAKRPHRLSEAQAIRIEYAAERGQLIAPGQYAYFQGDAANRRVADALEARGLIRQVGTNESDERVFQLTADGWAAYHNDPKVIRRLADDKHPDICPCRIR